MVARRIRVVAKQIRFIFVILSAQLVNDLLAIALQVAFVQRLVAISNMSLQRLQFDIRDALFFVCGVNERKQSA